MRPVGQLSMLYRAVVGLWCCGATAFVLYGATLVQESGRNLIQNGSFEQDGDADGVPDGWRTAGRASIVQRFRRVMDKQRGWIGRLECDRFEAGFPDSHAMVAQYGTVSVQQGRWYELSGWIRSFGLTSGTVEISLVNTRRWSQVGLHEIISPGAEWERFVCYFRATEDLPAAESRFQIYFRGTGVIELDDLLLREVASPPEPERRPIIAPAEGNWLVNSSFECGAEGWGAWSPTIPGWGAHLFRLIGRLDQAVSWHGRASWRLCLSKKRPIRAFFDYFDPVAHDVLCVLIGPIGWCRVEPGRWYTFSAFVRADRADVPIRLVIKTGRGRLIQKTVRVGEAWERVWLRWRASEQWAFPSIGLDLQETDGSEATVWLDALQWEEGSEPTEYRPRSSVEALWEPDEPSGIFFDPEEVISGTLRIWNDASPRLFEGELEIRDAWDRVIERRAIRTLVPQGEPVQIRTTHLVQGASGFYRLNLKAPSGSTQSVRLAILQPLDNGSDRFGMNHAFSWPWLIELAQKAGLGWWRDWSVQWRLVQEDATSSFDFGRINNHIERIHRLGGRVLMLLPFPSTPWNAMVDTNRLIREAGKSRYLRERLIVAQKPSLVTGFGKYAQAAVQRFAPMIQAVEILNEPLYTTYALPRSWGWKLEDYLELLRVAYGAIKEIAPDVPVVGGIAASPDHELVRRFIEEGGLRWCDVMNLHLYPDRGDPEHYYDAFQSCSRLVKKSGFARPIWLTEIGIYADDDPPLQPYRISDAAMNRALRPSELRAAADLVKLTAVVMSAGVDVMLFHAGTCGSLNEDSAGNMFFEYGGRPRITLAALNVLARTLGPEVRFSGKESYDSGLVVYRFEGPEQRVAIVWRVDAEEPVELRLHDKQVGYDLMGNRVSSRTLKISWIPWYIKEPREAGR